MLCSAHSVCSSGSFLIRHRVHSAVKGFGKGEDVLWGLVCGSTILFLFMLLVYCLEKEDWFVC